MSRKPVFPKDPNSDEPIGFDWSKYLAAIGATVKVANSVWIISGPDAVLTQHGGSILAGEKSTQVFIAAGTPGAHYTVTNRITTDSTPAVIDDRSYDVVIEDK